MGRIFWRYFLGEGFGKVWGRILDFFGRTCWMFWLNLLDFLGGFLMLRFPNPFLFKGIISS